MSNRLVLPQKKDILKYDLDPQVRTLTMGSFSPAQHVGSPNLSETTIQQEKPHVQATHVAPE